MPFERRDKLAKRLFESLLVLQAAHEDGKFSLK
jgi:hypothetical protein